MSRLQGKRIAILATDGFEQSELLQPRQALREAGAEVDVVSPSGGNIRGWDHTDWGESVRVDRELAAAKVEQYDGLVLPGGQINPDKLRGREDVQSFVRGFLRARKPIAAICHAPWILIDADPEAVRGRRMTSYASVRTDLRNAGAQWVDESVVEDDGIITSRNPGDLEPFCDRAIQAFAAGSREATASR